MNIIKLNIPEGYIYVNDEYSEYWEYPYLEHRVVGTSKCLSCKYFISEKILETYINYEYICSYPVTKQEYFMKEKCKKLKEQIK